MKLNYKSMENYIPGNIYTVHFEQIRVYADEKGDIKALFVSVQEALVDIRIAWFDSSMPNYELENFMAQVGITDEELDTDWMNEHLVGKEMNIEAVVSAKDARYTNIHFVNDSSQSKEPNEMDCIF